MGFPRGAAPPSYYFFSHLNTVKPFSEGGRDTSRRFGLWPETSTPSHASIADGVTDAEAGRDLRKRTWWPEEAGRGRGLVAVAPCNVPDPPASCPFGAGPRPRGPRVCIQPACSANVLAQEWAARARAGPSAEAGKSSVPSSCFPGASERDHHTGFGCCGTPFPRPGRRREKGSSRSGVAWEGRGGGETTCPGRPRSSLLILSWDFVVCNLPHAGVPHLTSPSTPRGGGAAGGTQRELTGTQLHATQGGVACARRVGDHEERCAMRTSPGQERLHSRPKPLPTAVVHGPRPTCPSHTRLPGAVSTRARGAGGGWNSPKAQEADGGRGAG